MARPTIYNQDILDKAKYYSLNLPEDEVIPSIEGLADWIDVSRSNIYLWCSQDDKKEFSDIVDSILEKQGKVLINGSLQNRLNASISKLILSKHGYRESSDVTSGDKPLQGVVFLPPKDVPVETTTKAGTGS